jgi:hypothetical protein
MPRTFLSPEALPSALTILPCFRLHLYQTSSDKTADKTGTFYFLSLSKPFSFDYTPDLSGFFFAVIIFFVSHIYCNL